MARCGPGLLLLGLTLLLLAITLAPELQISQLPVNDGVFHLAASQRLGASLLTDAPFMDPWVSDWSLGYPVWSSYQPLGHLLLAACIGAAAGLASPAATSAALLYALLLLLPVSAYWGARRLGLGSLGAGLFAALILSPAGLGELGDYGLGLGAYTWRGSGLFTQLVGVHFLVLFLGSARRTLDDGTGLLKTSLLLAAACLSHIVLGYAAVLSAVVLACVGAAQQRPRRIVRLLQLGVPALCLILWFLVPLLLGRSYVNRSSLEPLWKWNSHGAEAVLRQLATGNLLDAERLPVLTALLCAGVLVSLVHVAQPLHRRLLSLCGLWLLLFFGRDTWGHLLSLLGLVEHFHLHRLQVPFELAALLVTCAGIEVGLTWALQRNVTLAAVAGLTLAAALSHLASDRAGYLKANGERGRANLVAYAHAEQDLERSMAAVRGVLERTPGRAWAGHAKDWGGRFRVGDTPVYAHLTRSGIDQTSFLYHAMSLPSDLMPSSDGSAAHDEVFGVRAIVAPEGLEPRAHWRQVAHHGQFRVYETNSGGYFGLVDVARNYAEPAGRWPRLNRAWLQSDWMRAGVTLELEVEGAARSRPRHPRFAPLPEVPAGLRQPRGRILSSSRVDQRYRAEVELLRDCHLLLKISWHPHLSATVDGVSAPVIHVAPGFAAVPLTEGKHEVEVRYAPPPLRPLLALLGALLFGALALVTRRPAFTALGTRATAHVAALQDRLRAARPGALLGILALLLLALRPLLRGQLIAGHDATAYPPRLTELARALSDGQLPPLWAADLSAGFGQPLFGFVAPLSLWAAWPLRMLGMSLTDSLQLGLLALFALGAAGMYGLARRFEAGPAAALAVTALWLFSPYVALDLFVRAAFMEAAGVALAPLALFAVARAADLGHRRAVGVAGLAVAAVMLSHNAVALLLMPVLLAFALSQATRRGALAALLSLALGLALSAFFWFPALYEQDLIRTELLRSEFLQHERHAIAPMQLLASPWGFGESVPGPNDGMSFALGPLHLLLALAGLWTLWRAPDARRRQLAVLGATALSGAWLATDWANGLWAQLPLLQYLAYPWRALMLPCLALPLLATPLLASLRGQAAWFVVALTLGLNLPHTAPAGYLVFDDEYYAPESIAQLGLTTTTRQEYVPRWAELGKPYTSERLVGRRGRLHIASQDLRSDEQRFALRSPMTQWVEVATHDYPGWTVLVDGRETPTRRVDGRGTFEFELPVGQHEVIVRLSPGPVRRAATLLSTLAALLVLGLIARRIPPLFKRLGARLRS